MTLSAPQKTIQSFDQNLMASKDIKTFKSLKLLFWNARSLKKRINELPLLLPQLDVFVCVETWLSSEKDQEQTINYPGFVTFRKDRHHSRGGGILMLIRKNVAYTEMKNLLTPDISVEICGIKITNTNPELKIVACYRAPGLTLAQDQWDMIVSNIHMSPIKMLFHLRLNL